MWASWEQIAREMRELRDDLRGSLGVPLSGDKNTEAARGERTPRRRRASGLEAHPSIGHDENAGFRRATVHLDRKGSKGFP